MTQTLQADDVQALAVIPREIQALSIGREPAEVLKEARKAAVALTEVINSKKKKVTFNGETYLENEDWLTVARFYGVTVRIASTKYVEFGEDEYKVRGYEATAEAFLVGTNQVISTAESMCLSDEPNWGRKPLFQLRSMAQTRAGSRVLRQVFGWVVVLAGYKPTPAEEMTQEENHHTEVSQVRRKAGGMKTHHVEAAPIKAETLSPNLKFNKDDRGVEDFIL